MSEQTPDRIYLKELPSEIVSFKKDDWHRFVYKEYDEQSSCSLCGTSLPNEYADWHYPYGPSCWRESGVEFKIELDGDIIDNIVVCSNDCKEELEQELNKRIISK